MYTENDRNRIVEAANRGHDWVELAASLNVCYKTEHRWSIQEACVPKKRGGKKPRTLNSNETDMILSWVENKTDITLREIAEKVRQIINKTTSITTIAKTLEDVLHKICSY